MKLADIESLDWSKGDGLVPAVVQCARSGAVLMLGYMNREALSKTLSSGRVTFFSRRRQALWMKGETSGNTLSAVQVSRDCDRDAILVQAIASGPVCHEGTSSCFPESLPADAEPFAFLAKLESVIVDRISHPTAASYTSKLHSQGMRRVAQKVGEEGLELALATAGGSAEEVTAECADLLYVTLLALAARNLSLSVIVAELENRHAVRGTTLKFRPPDDQERQDLN